MPEGLSWQKALAISPWRQIKDCPGPRVSPTRLSVAFWIDYSPKNGLEPCWTAGAGYMLAGFRGYCKSKAIQISRVAFVVVMKGNLFGPQMVKVGGFLA